MKMQVVQVGTWLELRTDEGWLWVDGLKNDAVPFTKGHEINLRLEPWRWGRRPTPAGGLRIIARCESLVYSADGKRAELSLIGYDDQGNGTPYTPNIDMGAYLHVPAQEVEGLMVPFLVHVDLEPIPALVETLAAPEE